MGGFKMKTQTMSVSEFMSGSYKRKRIRAIGKGLEE